MDVTPAIPADRKVVDGYGDGGFRIAGEWIEGAVLVSPLNAVAWDASNIADLNASDAEAVAAGLAGAELVLLGTGVRPVHPPKAFRDALSAAGLRLEVMDTGAACRTYNVLLSEDRRVAAALLAI